MTMDDRAEYESEVNYDKSTGLPVDMFKEELGAGEIKWTQDL